jgi:hypothetical protein
MVGETVNAVIGIDTLYRFRNWCMGFDLRFGGAGGGHDRGSCLCVCCP